MWMLVQYPTNPVNNRWKTSKTPILSYLKLLFIEMRAHRFDSNEVKLENLKFK